MRVSIHATYMQHLQLQKHADLALQMQLPCIGPSCEYHIDEAVFEMGLLQSRYFLYMSVRIQLEIKS